MPILLFIVFIDLVGFGIVIPLLPFYAGHHGASPFEVTALMAVYSGAQFLTAPLLGALSDRFGRKPVLAASLAGAAAGYVAMAAAPSWGWLLAARAATGAMAGNIATAQAYIADVTAPGDRARGMGLFGAAVGAGFVVGPALGGLLAGGDPVDFAAPLFAAAAAAGAALVVTLLVLREPARPAAGASAPAGLTAQAWLGAVAGALRRTGLSGLVTAFFLVMLAFAGFEATFALWAERRLEWTTREVGMVLAGVGAVAAVVQGGLVGRLARRFGEARVLGLGVAALACALTALALARTPVQACAALALLAAGFGLANPTLHSLVSRGAGAARQGASLGVAQSASSLARIVGPAGAGALFAAAGPAWPFLAGAAVLAAVFAGLRRGLAPRRARRSA